MKGRVDTKRSGAVFEPLVTQLQITYRLWIYGRIINKERIFESKPLHEFT